MSRWDQRCEHAMMRLVCGHVVGHARVWPRRGLLTPVWERESGRGAPLGARRLVGFPLAGWEGNGAASSASHPPIRTLVHHTTVHIGDGH